MTISTTRIEHLAGRVTNKPPGSHAAAKPESAVRRHLREQFRLFRLLPRIVTDVQYLLDPDTDHSQGDQNAQMVHLWDPELGELPAGLNYAKDDD